MLLCHLMRYQLLSSLPLDQTNSTKIASLAPICAEVGETDAVARDILQQAARRLVETAIAALRQLQFQGAGRLAITGGVFSSSIVRQTFENTLHARAPGVTLTEPALPAIAGAGLLALRAAGVEPDTTIIDNLGATWNEQFPSVEPCRRMFNTT